MKVVPPVADPEAELARLRRPPGPWLHLLDAAPADARQLGWVLGQHGAVVRILRGHCGRSTYGFMDEVGAALQLPGDPAEDWPALGALLTDMAWLPGTGHVLVVTRASLLLAAEPVRELGGLVEAVRAVARGRAEEGEPVPFHVVLQDDTVGIATLRRRLDAVGAKHSDLSGWDAEEPVAEVVVGGRSVLAPGDVRPDEVDLAAGAAASEVDGALSLVRAWEEFRGGTGTVRVYAPVLTDPRRAAPVAALVAGAAAKLGASCVVVPVPAKAAARDPRQAAVAEGGTVIWPVPEVPPAPRKPVEQSAAPASGPAGSRAAGDAEVGVRTPAKAPPDGAAGKAATAPAAPDARADGGTDTTESPVEAGSAEPASVAGAAAGPVGPGTVADPAVAGVDAGAGGAVEAETPAEDEERPGDLPGGDFELVAADLQWYFDPGDPEPDAVDAAVVAHVSTAGRTSGLFRTWVKDPDDGWVRVVLAYVGPRGSIAEVEGERTAVVETLQRAGAVRCCVEVIAASDGTDVHRWLEDRCHPLWSPTVGASTVDASTAGASTADASSGNAPIPGGPTPDASAPDGPVADGPAQGGPTGRGGSTAGDPHPDPPYTGRLAASVPADTIFSPGPDADGVEDLVRWATDHTGVTALVTAWADLDGARTLVVGVALDGTTHPDPIRSEAGRHAPGARIEPFVPSRGLDPAHLMLIRSGTRAWRRRAERTDRTERTAAPERPGSAGALSRPDAPTVVALGPLPVRDTDEPRGDIQLAGFTLVGIDRQTEVGKGAPAADDRDAAIVEWARAEPAAIALLRAVASVGEETIPVYCACVTPEADPEAVRRQLAAAVAATGTTRAAAEAFAPAGEISAFHLDLAVGSTRLWPVRS